MHKNYGQALRQTLKQAPIYPFIGVYDVFSASLAARDYDGLFLSGFSFAASYYGLPDMGFIAWSDMVAFTQRVRTVLPTQHIVVDIDDGYGDTETACHVVSVLESVGASAVILEDQQRPRRCGHFDDKQLMTCADYLQKLEKVLQTRQDLYVIARTDAITQKERIQRVVAFAKTSVDAILIEAVESLDQVKEIKTLVDKPLMFNQIAGGKSPNYSLTELHQAGISLVNYSTPCLFSAQAAIANYLQHLKDNDGLLSDSADVTDCKAALEENLANRDCLQATRAPQDAEELGYVSFAKKDIGVTAPLTDRKN